MKTKNAFVTYSLSDQSKVKAFLSSARSTLVSFNLLGRHVLENDCSESDVVIAMNRCEITLVLASKATLNDSRVNADIALGNEKRPRNALLIIWLECPEDVEGSALGLFILSTGAEVAAASGLTVGMEHILSQVERIKDIHSSQKTERESDCSR